MENHHGDSHEKRTLDDENTSTKFTDMCDNVIDLIMRELKLEDLANISDTNQRLQNIAASLFSRKFQNHLITFDSETYFDYLRETIYGDYVIRFHANQPIVKITDANIWFRLLRNFGKFFYFIRIKGNLMKFELFPKHSKKYVNVNEYVFKYCGDSMEILELDDYEYITVISHYQNFIHFKH